MVRKDDVGEVGEQKVYERGPERRERRARRGRAERRVSRRR